MRVSIFDQLVGYNLENAGENDPAECANSLLHSFLTAENVNSAQDFLDRLFDHAEPLICNFVRLKLRSFHTGRNNYDEQKDICQEVAVQLLSRLWEIRENRSLPPIDNFRSYVFTCAQNACHKHVRTKHPAWWCLKNRIRYVLNHKPQFAVWSGQNEQTTCGLAGWAGRFGASSEANPSQVALNEFTSKSGKTAHGCADLAVVLEEFLKWQGRPVLLDNLVSAMAEICGVRELQFVGTSDELSGSSHKTLHDLSLDPAGQLEQKLYLERLWREICELPLNQRLALLLNMRHGGNSEAVILFTQTGTTSLREIASILNIEFEEFVELWNHLPLDDNTIAVRLGLTRQQIINLRKSARERLARRIRMMEETS